MIDVKFGLFWSGGEISYLRYLTFLSLRKFHPNATIELHISDKFAKDGYKWGCEKQDFEAPEFDQVMSVESLEDIGIEVKEIDLFSKYPPNYQSEFFRWWWIKENGVIQNLCLIGHCTAD